MNSEMMINSDMVSPNEGDEKEKLIKRSVLELNHSQKAAVI
jgi:hypothetical protein